MDRLYVFYLLVVSLVSAAEIPANTLKSELKATTNITDDAKLRTLEEKNTAKVTGFITANGSIYEVVDDSGIGQIEEQSQSQLPAKEFICNLGSVVLFSDKPCEEVVGAVKKTQSVTANENNKQQEIVVDQQQLMKKSNAAANANTPQVDANLTKGGSQAYDEQHDAVSAQPTPQRKRNKTPTRPQTSKIQQQVPNRNTYQSGPQHKKIIFKTRYINAANLSDQQLKRVQQQQRQLIRKEFQAYKRQQQQQLQLQQGRPQSNRSKPRRQQQIQMEQQRRQQYLAQQMRKQQQQQQDDDDEVEDKKKMFVLKDGKVYEIIEDYEE